MVPHCSICAKPKRDKNPKSVELLTRDRQFGHQFARLERNRAHLQKPADKIFPRKGQPQGIRPPQICADRRTPARGHQEPPEVAQLRHQKLPAACSQGLEQVSRSTELLIRLWPRTRDEVATPPKWFSREPLLILAAQCETAPGAVSQISTTASMQGRLFRGRQRQPGVFC